MNFWHEPIGTCIGRLYVVSMQVLAVECWCKHTRPFRTLQVMYIYIFFFFQECSVFVRQKSIGLRFFTVYGPLGRPDMAYFSFASDILANRTIQVRDHGNQIRDFTYVDDVVDGVLRALRIIDSQPAPLVLNLGRGEPHTVMELVSNLENSLGRKARVQYVGQSTGDVPQTFADISLARDLIGYRPVVSFAEGLFVLFPCITQSSITLASGRYT